MKGLLYKDFIYLKKYFFSVGSILAMTIFTIICVTFFTCAVNGHTVENAYSSMYFMVLGVILIFITANSLSTSLFVLDEKPANINFLFSTPPAAKGHIQSKYYSLLIIQLGILLICFLVDIVRMLMIGEYAISSSLACMILFCISLILLAIRIPFIIRYGSGISTTVRSAYIIAIIAFIIIYALFGDISFFFEENGLSLEDIFAYLQSGKVILPLSFIPYISVLIYYLSYRISLKLYRKGVESYEQ